MAIYNSNNNMYITCCYCSLSSWNISWYRTNYIYLSISTSNLKINFSFVLFVYFFSSEYQWLCSRTSWKWNNCRYCCTINCSSYSWWIIMYWCSTKYTCQVCFFFVLSYWINTIKSKVRRSWLLRQLLPRLLIDQFTLKQLINRVRHHLHHNHDITQLSVARKFIRIFSENTRSFAGKLFPVKFPVRKSFFSQ